MTYDLIGMKFGMLTVTGKSNKPNKKPHIRWVCVCVCGRVIDNATTYSLRSGETQSCGHCKISKTLTRHGHAKQNTTGKTPEYRAWRAMIDRCEYPSSISYKNYGGRGIRIHHKLRSFFGFLEELGPKPSQKHTLDRIDTNGNYAPGNVRWATRLEQGRNQRKNRWITAFEKTLTISEWARELNCTRSFISYHLSKGKTMLWILSHPNKHFSVSDDGIHVERK